MNKTTRETIGKQEEDRIFAAVSGIPDLKIYRNIYIPQGFRRTAEVDLLILSAKGIFAIEAKGFGFCTVTGSRIRYEWTRRYKRKSSTEVKVKFYSPIRQSNAHLEAVSRYLGVPSSFCCGLVVFSDRTVLKKVPPNSSSCIILQTSQLGSTLRRMLARRKRHFSPAELRQLEARLDAIPKACDGIKRQHILQARQAERRRKGEQERRRAGR